MSLFQYIGRSGALADLFDNFECFQSLEMGLRSSFGTLQNIHDITHGDPAHLELVSGIGKNWELVSGTFFHYYTLCFKNCPV